jgi:hypothetical protein
MPSLLQVCFSSSFLFFFAPAPFCVPSLSILPNPLHLLNHHPFLSSLSYLPFNRSLASIEAHLLCRSASSTNLLRELYAPKEDKIVLHVSNGMKKVFPRAQEDTEGTVRGIVEKMCVAKCWEVADVSVIDDLGRPLDLDTVSDFCFFVLNFQLAILVFFPGFLDFEI